MSTRQKQYSTVGKREIRRDAQEKVTGTAVYTCDVVLPGMLYAKVLRSPHPHARIKNINTEKAEQLKGVRAVLCYKNTVDTFYNQAAALMELFPGDTLVMDQRIFDKVVRYVGDEVAAVAADTEEIAQQALRLIEVEYEILPAVFDAVEAQKPEAPLIHEDKANSESIRNVSGSPTSFSRGDIDKGFAESDEIVEVCFDIAPIKQMEMETHGAVAEMKNDRLTVFSTTQNVQVVRGQLAHVFGLPMSQITVKNPPYVGGGFGVRIGLSGKAELIATALAMASRKPVRYVYTRHEGMIASETRHGGRVEVKLGAKKDGTFMALDLKAALNKGAYTSHGGGITGTLGLMTTSLYRIPNINYLGYTVYTNTTMGGAMRGYGNPQGNMTLNRAVDIMAERLGIDPLDLRRMNATRKGDEYMLPYPCNSSTLDRCMVTGAKEIGWNNRAEYNSQKGVVRRGIGMSFGTHFSGGHSLALDYENAIIAVQADGSVTVSTAATDLGTGCNTSLAQIAAEALGVPFSSVQLIYADSSATPYGFGSHSSRSVFMHGNAIVEAAEAVKKEILEFATSLCQKTGNDLCIENGIIRAIDGSRCFPRDLHRMIIFPHSKTTDLEEGELQSSITLSELAHYAHSCEKQFIGKGSVSHINAPPWFASFVDVSVDTETGKVTVNKMVGVHDVGTVINPDYVEGQIQGGALQGMGFALGEQLTYNSRTGEQYVNDMQQYMQPTSMDGPPIVALTEEEEVPNGPFGAKGLGETPCIASPGATINAICNALGINPSYVKVPLTPEHILQLIKENVQDA